MSRTCFTRALLSAVDAYMIVLPPTDSIGITPYTNKPVVKGFVRIRMFPFVVRFCDTKVKVPVYFPA